MATKVTTQTPTHARPDLLRRSLQLDGLVSIVSGLTLGIAAGPLARFTGVDTLAITAAGAVGLLYGVRIFAILRRDRPILPFARTVVALNAATAVACAALAITGWPSLSAEVRWAVAGVTEIAALLAFVQYLGMRRVRNNSER